MFNSDEALIVIPARGGSKRLPGKNMRNLNGKPLIAWTIEAAVTAAVAKNIIVTSDDKSILELAHSYGVTAHLRSDELSSDTASTMDVVLDCLKLREVSANAQVKNIVLLQPTSPLRTAQDIVDSFALYNALGRKTVVTVCETEHPVEWAGRLNGSKILGIDFKRTSRSQELGPSYRVNGAIYIFARDLVESSGTMYSSEVFAHVMPRERSFDIDTLMDFKMCEFFMQDRTSPLH